MKHPAVDVTRRGVVKSALIPLAAVRGSGADSAVTVGLIGAGERGSFVAALMAKYTPVRVVALCDIFEEKMEAARRQIQRTAS